MRAASPHPRVIHVVSILNAPTGQAATHIPQPVQRSVSTRARRWYSVLMAWYSQRPWQDMQITSFQAMQVSRFRRAVPRRGVTDSMTSICSGQAVTQALQ